MTFAKNDLFCDPHPPHPLHSQKLTIGLLFKNKIICKKVTNFNPPLSMWTSSIYGPLCVFCDINFFFCFKKKNYHPVV